jgi:flagellar protein FlaG
MDISAASRATNTVATPTAGAAQVPPEQKQMVQAVKAVNKSGLFGQDNELTFQMDRQTRRPIIRLVNSRTKEVIRQIPPEYVLRMAEDFRKNQHT